MRVARGNVSRMNLGAEQGTGSGTPAIKASPDPYVHPVLVHFCYYNKAAGAG
jgi:hypothetical protein